jgi:CubicO group peptidase (beta-lactamase class C family)
MKLRQTYLTFLTLFALVIYSQTQGQVKTVSGRNISSAELDNFLKTQMDSLQMPGLSIAIINNGKVVYHRALGIGNIDTKTTVNEESIFEAASISKPVFAYFVMKMVDKGLLNLDTPLYKYLPYPDIEKDERYKLITARLVLSHRTGFPNWRYFDPADSTLNIKFGDLYLKFTPGTQFYYSGEGFYYLAKVVAHLNNKTVQTIEPVFQREVTLPFKMQHTSFTGNEYISKHKISGHEKGKVQFYNGIAWPVTLPEMDSSYFNPAASLHTNALEFSKFIIGLMENKGLTKKSMKEMLKPQVQLPKENSNFIENGDTAWGLGFGIAQTPFGTRYEHGGNNGNFQSFFMMFKDKKFGYVFFTNCDKGNDFNKKLRALLTQGN